MLSIQVATFLLFSIILCSVSSYKILVVYPTGSFSHQRVQIAFSQGLAEAGHEVTIISPNPFKTTNPNIIKQIDINNTYECIKVFDLSSSIGSYELLDLCKTYWTMVTTMVLENPEVMEIYKNVKNEHFDAVVMEALPYFPLYTIQETFKDAAFVGMLSHELMPIFHGALGNVIHPILHPSFFIAAPQNPNLWERIRLSHFQAYFEYWRSYSLMPELDKIIEKYFPESKSKSSSLIKSYDLVIEGITPVLDNVRPLLPNTIQIGFMHIKAPMPLPTDLQKYLDNSKNGVIYLSFGSNVKSANLKPEIKRVLIDTIKRLDYDVLWKFEDETLVGKPDNVKIEKWLPQVDLLAHKNIKLFITQGGLQSLDETIARGVPVVIIPFFADQDANAMRMLGLGIGKRLPVEELSVEKIEETILEVIKNPM